MRALVAIGCLVTHSAIAAAPSPYVQVGHDVFAARGAEVSSQVTAGRVRLRGGTAASIDWRVEGLLFDRVEPASASSTSVNFLLGPRAEWRTGVLAWDAVRMSGPAGSVTVLGPNAFCYTVKLERAATASTLTFRYAGASRLEVAEAGRVLRVFTAGGVFSESGLRAFQGGQEIAARYVRLGGDRYRIVLAGADPTLPVEIDPSIDVLTYLGGSLSDLGNAVAAGDLNSVLITGSTSSAGLATAGTVQTALSGPTDAFVAKVVNGSVLWITYLGGSSDDTGLAIAQGPNQSVYVAGSTRSMNFPVTMGVLEPAFGGGTSDGWLARLDANGANLLFSTYVGGAGADVVRAIAVNASGEVFVHVQAGSPSTGFPLRNSLKPLVQGVNDAFIGSVSATGALKWGTFLGGTTGEAPFGIAVAPSGAVCVAGQTSSNNFPLNGGFGATYVFYESYVACLTAPADMPAVTWSLVFGGADYDFPTALAVDSTGVWIGGVTYSQNFPTTADAAQRAFGGQQDAFLARIAVDGSALEYSTFLGGSGIDQAQGLALGARVYLGGLTSSADFPKTTGLDGGQAGFVAAFDRGPAPVAHAWSIALTGAGITAVRGVAASGSSVYATGETTAPNLPNAVPSTFGGATDAFAFIHVDPALDAGADAGTADAGMMTDAGTTMDAGTTDAGPAQPKNFSVGCGCSTDPFVALVAAALVLLTRRRRRSKASVPRAG